MGRTSKIDTFSLPHCLICREVVVLEFLLCSLYRKHFSRVRGRSLEYRGAGVCEINICVRKMGVHGGKISLTKEFEINENIIQIV